MIIVASKAQPTACFPSHRIHKNTMIVRRACMSEDQHLRKGPCSPLPPTFDICSTKKHLYQWAHSTHATQRKCQHARQCSVCSCNNPAHHPSPRFSNPTSLNPACDNKTPHAPSATPLTTMPVSASKGLMRHSRRA